MAWLSDRNTLGALCQCNNSARYTWAKKSFKDLKVISKTYQQSSSAEWLTVHHDDIVVEQCPLVGP